MKNIKNRVNDSARLCAVAPDELFVPNLGSCKLQNNNLGLQNCLTVLYLGILASSVILQEDIKLRYPDSSSSWLRERLKEQEEIHIAVTPGILHGKSTNHFRFF